MSPLPLDLHVERCSLRFWRNEEAWLVAMQWWDEVDDLAERVAESLRRVRVGFEVRHGKG